MWSLHNLQTGRNFYMIPEKDKYTVSRSNDCGDLILTDDSSISRKHAYLRVHKQKLYITDAGSKYGTYINENLNTNETIKPNEPIQLSVNDKVRFGRLNNVWSVENLTIITLPSTLSQEEKDILVKDLSTIGGHVLQSWSNKCTHLTVSNLTVTIKVLQALCHGIPIVKPSYWKSIISAVKNTEQSLPKCEDHLPPLDEQFFNSNDTIFNINLKRKTLFTNRTFIFMIKKHMEQFESVINLAGGTCISLDQHKMHKKKVLQSNVSVIQYNPSTQSQTSQDITAVSECLYKNNFRTIPDNEIGLAILHCSTEKFCNPKYNREKDFDVNSLMATSSKILAENTPISVEIGAGDGDSAERNLHKQIIPETEENEKELSTLFDSVTKNDEIVSTKMPLEKGSSTVDSLEKICLVQESSIEPSSMPSEIMEVQSSGLKRKSTNQLDAPINKKKALENSQSQNIPATDFITPKPRKPNTETQPKINTSLKRVRELLANKDSDNDDDDDNNDNDDGDNIFQFNKNPIPLKKSKVSNEPEDPFMFNVKPTSIRNETETQSTMDKLSQQYKQMNSLDQTRKPIKLSLEDGWLSSSMLLSKTKIKMEIGDDTTVTGAGDEPSWIDEIRNGFTITKKPMILVSRICNMSTIETVSDGSNQSKETPNFKVFVKNMNYIPQTRVVKTKVLH